MAAKKSPANDQAPKKGSSPVLWIALGCGALSVLFLCIGGAGLGGYFFFVRKPTDDAKNPGAAKKGEVKPPIEIKTDLPDGSQSLGISPDGKFAIVRGSDQGKKNNVQIWNLADKKKLYEFTSPSGSTQACAVSPDAKFAAYSNQDSRQVTLIDMADGKEIKKLRKKVGQLEYFVTGMQFSPKSDFVVVCAGKNLVAWDVMSGNEKFALTNDADFNSISAFFDDGKKLASGDHNSAVKIWDINLGKPSAAYPNMHGKEHAKSVAVSSDGKTIVSVPNISRGLRVWDHAANSVQSRDLPETPSLWSNLLLTPDGNTLIYSTSMNNILLIDLKTAAKNYELKGHTNMVTSLALTADGNTLISVSRDNSIRIWDIKDLK
jgi:WD40 repeat protein